MMIGIVSDIWLNFGDAYVKLYGKVKKLIKKKAKEKGFCLFFMWLG